MESFTRDSVQIARLEEKVGGLSVALQDMADEMRAAREAAERSMEQLRGELAAVQRQLTEARGGWKTLMLLGGALGTPLVALAWGWLKDHIRIQ